MKERGLPMPTYEYECTHCAHRFERFQSMKDEPVKRCPECRHKVRRILSGGAGFLFKGEGFYITDHRSADYRKRAKEESGKGAEKPPAKKGGGEKGKTKEGGAKSDGGGKNPSP